MHLLIDALGFPSLNCLMDTVVDVIYCLKKVKLSGSQ